MNALQYYKKYSTNDLLKLQESITSNPENKNPSPDSIWRYKKPVHKKLDEIARAIAMHMQDKREANGDIINQAGYTGRQSKRKR